jgi:hypothetical protein
MRAQMLGFIRIVLLVIVAAVLYGLAHDQVTIRISPEYFTLGHPRIIDTDSITLIALAWGVVATWWMGLILGVPVALCCTVGTWPRLGARDVALPLAMVLAVMAVGAAISALAARQSAIGFPVTEMRGVKLSPEQQRSFFVAFAAHNASYFIGATGGGALCVAAIVMRRRRVPRRSQE